MNVVDIAKLLEEFDGENVLVLFRLLPKEIAVDVFSYLALERQKYVIEAITDREISNIINDLFLDDTVDLLDEMPANLVKKILRNANEKTRKLINQFLKYPDDSAGSVMTIEYVDLKKEMDIKQALAYIRKIGVDKETIDICYVIDSNRKLEGVVSIRKLILNDGDVKVGDIMDANTISINTHDDQEWIASLFKKYDLVVMPVVDNENRLVGIITVDDVIDIIDKENTEDFQKMAAMVPSDEEYLKSNVFVLAKHRVVWLLILMVSATFSGRIMGKYQDVLQSMVILAAFIPMLMDAGGNAGSQSSTLIIRGLALKEIRMKDFLNVLWKEFRVSLLVGLALVSVNFLRLFLIERVDLMVNVVVNLSLFLTIVLSKLVGGILPIIAKKVKLDPAIMAGPLITTIVDAAALLLYFSLATSLLHL